MAKKMNQNDPRRLTSELLDCMQWVRLAATPAKKDFDPLTYRDQLSHNLSHMKQAAKRVVECGHLDGLDLIGEISVILEEISHVQKPNAANEIFWDQLSQHYPVKGGWEVDLKRLSNNLQLRILEQMITHDRNPQNIILNQLKRLSDDAFMDGLTLVLKLTAPSEMQYSIDFYKALFALKARTSSPDFIPAAVEHIAAHQDLYMSYLTRVMGIAALPESLKAKENEIAEKLVVRRRRLVLSAMGYDDNDAQAMIDSGAAVDVVPRSEDFEKMKLALTLPAEFLCMLYQVIESPVISEIAELSLSGPAGRTPYAFLERMGIARPSEWHIRAQEKSSLDEAIPLYEHALHTPGLEVSTSKFAMREFKPKDAKLLDRISSLLGSVNVKDPECRRKGQQIFDALVTNMGWGRSSKELTVMLEGPAIPGALYGKYPELKGKKLETDLGM